MRALELLCFLFKIGQVVSKEAVLLLKRFHGSLHLLIVLLHLKHLV